MVVFRIALAFITTIFIIRNFDNIVGTSRRILLLTRLLRLRFALLGCLSFVIFSLRVAVGALRGVLVALVVVGDEKALVAGYSSGAVSVVCQDLLNLICCNLRRRVVLFEPVELSIPNDHDDVDGALVRNLRTLLLKGLQSPVLVEADVHGGTLGLHTLHSGKVAANRLGSLDRTFLVFNCVFRHIILISNSYNILTIYLFNRIINRNYI